MGVATIGELNNSVFNIHGYIIASWSLLISRKSRQQHKESAESLCGNDQGGKTRYAEDECGVAG